MTHIGSKECRANCRGVVPTGKGRFITSVDCSLRGRTVLADDGTPLTCRRIPDQLPLTGSFDTREEAMDACTDATDNARRICTALGGPTP